MKNKKYRLTRLTELILTIVSAVVLVFIFVLVGAHNGYLDIDEPISLNDGWYIIENGDRVYIDLSQEQHTEDGSFVMHNDTISQKYAGMMVSTTGAQYSLKILQDDNVLYQYKESGFKRNEQMKANLLCDVIIPEKSDGMQTVSTIVFVYSDIADSMFKVPYITVGTAYDVFWEHIKSEMFPFAMVIILLFISFVMIGTYIYLRHFRLNDRRLISMSLFMIICCTWTVTNSPLTVQLCGAPLLVYNISFCMFMLMGIPICSFILNTDGMDKYRSVYVYMILFYINFIVQNILYFTGTAEFTNMLVVTHILIVIGIAVVLRALVKEASSSHQREIKLVLAAFIMLSICGIMALIIYWQYKSSYRGYIAFFWVGIFLFVMFLLCCIIGSMVRNMQFKAETMLYRELESIDMMTGLLNHIAFERDLLTIEKTSDRYENIAIIFISLSGMKRVNDRYGYKKGDEVILSAAGAVKRIFGESGKCYRTFGDEFCAIIMNPEENEADWGKDIALMADNINRSLCYEITVYWGCSMIRDEKGNIKSVSDWKYEADIKLQNKHHIEERS